ANTQLPYTNRIGALTLVRPHLATSRVCTGRASAVVRAREPWVAPGAGKHASAHHARAGSPDLRQEGEPMAARVPRARDREHSRDLAGGPSAYHPLRARAPPRRVRRLDRSTSASSCARRSRRAPTRSPAGAISP